MNEPVDRRRALASIAAGFGALSLAGCDVKDALSQDPKIRKVLDGAEGLNEYLQRLALSPQTLAREYPASDISAQFRANGTTDPDDPAYTALAQADFRDWRLEVGGLVRNPLQLSLEDLRRMPSRTQITRHDCVEGWSCIGQWTGVPLAAVLQRADLKPGARYIVFYCADALDPMLEPWAKYYESIDLTDAFHPQTILAYAMNGAPLEVAYGAPLRLRVERQLGYKMAKYIMRIEAVESFEQIEGGRGGYWEDRGYAWYAGI